MIRVYRFLNEGDERRLYLDAKCPKDWTHLEVYVWNSESQKTLYLDDLELVAFDDKP